MKKILLILFLLIIVALGFLYIGKKAPSTPQTIANQTHTESTTTNQINQTTSESTAANQTNSEAPVANQTSTGNPATTAHPITATNTPTTNLTTIKNPPETSNKPSSSVFSLSNETKLALEQGEKSLNQGEQAKAWTYYSLAMKGDIDIPTRRKIQKILDPIVATLRVKTEMTKCFAYSIQSGDSLTKIAKKNKTTVGLIREVNKKYDDNIIAGRTLQVIPQNLIIEVYKKSYFLVVYLENGLYYRSYEVGLGKDDKTPVGEFVIKQKEKQPVWTYTDENGRQERIKFGDPRHKIGTRWLGFDHDGIGIHGTIEPDSIGKNMSNGCVRMRNEEVEKLFDLVDYTTKVKICP